MVRTSDAKIIVERCQRDPEFFQREVLGWDPWEKQVEIAKSVRDHKKSAVKSCHDSGKTAAAARIGLWFLYSFQPSIVLTTAPTFRQVEELLWREIRGAYNKSRIPLGGEMYRTPKLNLDNDWFALGLSTDEPEKFQGFHSANILLIGDEAAGVPEDIFTAADTSLTTANARELLIGNPSSTSGRFYDAFHSKRHLYNRIHISAFMTPNFTEGKMVRPYLIMPEWVEEKRKEWGEGSPLYQIKVLGEFPEATVDTVIALAWLEAAAQRSLDPGGEASEIGCDVARFGDDMTSLAVRQGPVLLHLESHSQRDTMWTAGRCIEIRREWKAAKIKVDDIGIGGGVTDRLKEQGEPVVAINAGEKPSDPERYPDLRSELWFMIAERAKEGRLDTSHVPERQRALLEAQLTSPKYTIDSHGRRVVEKKSETKKRLGRSPDDADAVILAFAPAIERQPTGGFLF
jgi:hypothetical protein